MIDVGTGLAVLGIGAPIMIAVMKFVPSREDKYSKELCQTIHRGIDARLAKIEGKIDVLIERG